jgi:hypothetical protein
VSQAAQEAFTSAVWQAEAELELTRVPGRADADAWARWTEAAGAAEAEYCRAAGIPPCYGWRAWIGHEPAGRHDHLMRLRARLFAGYGPDAG